MAIFYHQVIGDSESKAKSSHVFLLEAGVAQAIAARIKRDEFAGPAPFLVLVRVSKHQVVLAVLHTTVHPQQIDEDDHEHDLDAASGTTKAANDEEEEKDEESHGDISGQTPKILHVHLVVGSECVLALVLRRVLAGYPPDGFVYHLGVLYQPPKKRGRFYWISEDTPVSNKKNQKKHPIKPVLLASVTTQHLPLPFDNNY